MEAEFKFNLILTYQQKICVVLIVPNQANLINLRLNKHLL